MLVHQTLETDFRQIVLPMNRREHFLDVLEQSFAAGFRAVERRENIP